MKAREQSKHREEHRASQLSFLSIKSIWENPTAVTLMNRDAIPDLREREDSMNDASESVENG